MALFNGFPAMKSPKNTRMEENRNSSEHKLNNTILYNVRSQWLFDNFAAYMRIGNPLAFPYFIAIRQLVIQPEYHTTHTRPFHQKPFLFAVFLFYVAEAMWLCQYIQRAPLF